MIEKLTAEERHALTDSATLSTEGQKALRIIDQQAEALASAEARIAAASTILSANGSFVACEALRALRGQR